LSQDILITTSTFGVVDSTPITTLEEAGYRVRRNPFGRRLTRDEILETLGDERIVGLLAGLEPLDREVLARSYLKAISRVGSGMANVDQDAAQEFGIKVDRTPDGPTSAVAELTLGAALSLLREIPALDRDLHQGRWVKRTGSQIEGRTVLIVGYGRIGARVAQLVSAFGASVIVADPFLTEAEVPFPLVSLEDGLPDADVISIHASGGDCLLDEGDLPRMKQGVLILNASRGGVVAERAILKGLERGVVAGAWLDVFLDEPYLGPLAGHPRVLLTPHVGSYTSECRRSMEREAVKNLLAALRDTRSRV